MDIENSDGYSCPINRPVNTAVIMWEYLCRRCQKRFEMPVPRGPTEERERHCPRCGSRDIERLNTFDFSTCPPGG